MKTFVVNKRVYDGLLYLLDNYTDDYVPPSDYINMIREKSLIGEEYYESIVEMFLSLVSQRQLLEDFINYFYCLGKRKDHSDKHFLMVLTYILTSILNVNNKDDIISICKEEKTQKIVNFLRFFNKEPVIERLLLIGCKYFEESYINENIVLNVKKNKDLLEDIRNYFEDLLAAQKAEYVREPTKPISPRVTNMMKLGPPPPVPVNTPEERLLQVKPAPRTTYVEPKIYEVLEELRREHKFSSQLLLQEANKNEVIKHLSIKPLKPHFCPTLAEEKPALQKKTCKTHKADKTEIPVKKNAATILREAARLIKEEERDIKRMNELVCGAADHASYEQMLDSLRAEEEQLKLQEVERKHLLGQLTREEAILAKRRITDVNKTKRAQIDKEKKETEEILKQMQQKHEEEIKQMIDKTQQIQKNIEAKKQDLIHKRQLEAQEVASASKQLYAEAMMRQKQELERRMEIIKEIKALSSLKELQTNKFDPTETMNVGLLCEMSLVELNERLILKRTSIKEEIENRQKCIRKQKLKQQQFLVETQQFVDACREQRKLLSDKKDSSYKQLKMLKTENQDILDLRERLERARKKRMELTKV